jgi:hypothetical protein
MISAQANSGHCQDTDDAHCVVCGVEWLWRGVTRQVGVGAGGGALGECVSVPCIWDLFV